MKLLNNSLGWNYFSPLLLTFLLTVLLIREIKAVPRNNIVGPSYTQPPRRYQSNQHYSSSLYADQDPYYSSASATMSNDSDNQPDRSGGRYPNRNNGDRYPDRNGDRYPNRNGDRYHPDRINEEGSNSSSGSGNGNDNSDPGISCNRCTRCKSGYCKSRGSGQSSCC